MLSTEVELPHDVPIWCVHGPDCFVKLLCCKLIELNGITYIWGYSIYRNVPGFRTLGLTLEEFTVREQNLKFFTEHAEAIDYMAKLTTPVMP